MEGYDDGGMRQVGFVKREEVGQKYGKAFRTELGRSTFWRLWEIKPSHMFCP